MDAQKKKAWKFGLFIFILLSGAAILFYPMVYLFNNSGQLKSLLLGFGILGPIILAFLIALQVIFVPIPGQGAGFVSGFIYGTTLGTVISMAGVIVGSYAAFFLSRKYGRPFVERVVSKKTLERFDKLCQEKGVFAIFLIFLLPALPDDAVCFMAGLTSIPMRTLVIVAALGRLPGFIVLNMMGSGIAQHESVIPYVIFGSLMVISFAIFWHKDHVEKIMLKMTR